MSHENFNELLKIVGPHIEKTDTGVMREAIKPAEHLAITLPLRYLGNNFTDMKYLFRVSTCIRSIVLETCEAIYKHLKDIYLKVPNTPSDWRRIAVEFEKKWNFPNCIGALDGKHVKIVSPNEGSNYFNYKGSHSIILLALVDANYRFLYYHVGANGRAGDAGVFLHSALSSGLESNSMGIPGPLSLPGRKEPVPHFVVGDDAFPLKPYLMKPFPSRAENDEMERRKRRIFDYRLSRARRMSENVFCILAARFGVFQTAMRLSPTRATIVTLACIALHNYLIYHKDRVFLTPTLTDKETETHDILLGDWHHIQNSCFENLPQIAGNRNASDARWVRNELKEYVNNEGQVSWQERLVFGRVMSFYNSRGGGTL